MCTTTIIGYYKWMQMIPNEIVNSLYCPKQYHMWHIFQCNSLPHICECLTDSHTEIICMYIGVSQYYHMVCIDVLLHYIRPCLTQSARNVRQCTIYSSPDILNIKCLNVYKCTKIHNLHKLSMSAAVRSP